MLQSGLTQHLYTRPIEKPGWLNLANQSIAVNVNKQSQDSQSILFLLLIYTVVLLSQTTSIDPGISLENSHDLVISSASPPVPYPPQPVDALPARDLAHAKDIFPLF